MALFHPQTRRHMINGVSYINVHVLLNLLIDLRKRDKLRGFPNEFDKINITGVHIL